jgi:hypothetical protein
MAVASAARGCLLQISCCAIRDETNHNLDGSTRAGIHRIHGKPHRHDRVAETRANLVRDLVYRFMDLAEPGNQLRR